MAIWHTRAALARSFISAAARYWLSVYPCVHREVHQWQRRARAMPSSRLRCVALENIDNERTNLEGAAAFAAFARRASRSRVVCAQVAFQAAYDYADTLAEQCSHNQVMNARRLHTALLDAVTHGSDRVDYYAYHGDDGDGGYLGTLVDTARTVLAELPAYHEVSRPTRLAAARIVEYQSRIDSPDHLAAWVKSEASADAGVQWWEIAAACGSSMLVFALMARGAEPARGLDEIVRLEEAYFPWIGALHTLLDSLVDRVEDVAAGRHSLIDYYGSTSVLVERLTLLTREARRRAEARSDHGHTLILAAMMGSYLSPAKAASSDVRQARAYLVEAMGGLARPTLAVFWLRRGLAVYRPRRRRPITSQKTVSVPVSRPR